MSPSRIHCVFALRQCFEALFDRIGAGPLLTKPIGVFVSSGFHHGVERKQMQCLLRSILHGGNSERAHRFAVRLWDVDTSQGLRLITPALQCMYCLCLLLWCVPNFLVHTGGFLAIVFRHSSNGKNFAAIRVGQQALQGSHLAPSALPSLPARYALGVGERCGGWPANRWRTIPPLRVRPHQQLALSSSALPHEPISQVLSREAP